jgi:hypothetical protein
VPGDVQIVDAVCAGEHPRDDRGDLAGRMRTGVAGQTDPVGDRGVQAGRLRQPHHRHQTGTRHEVRIVERGPHHRRVMA